MRKDREREHSPDIGLMEWHFFQQPHTLNIIGFIIQCVYICLNIIYSTANVLRKVNANLHY